MDEVIRRMMQQSRRTLPAFPWEADTFVIGGDGKNYVTKQGLKDYLGPTRYRALIAAYTEWRETGVRPATPEGIPPIMMSMGKKWERTGKVCHPFYEVN